MSRRLKPPALDFVGPVLVDASLVSHRGPEQHLWYQREIDNYCGIKLLKLLRKV